MDLFLDANAHVAMNPKALAKFNEINNSRAGHGHASSPSVPGRAAANVIEESRTKIAELLGAKSSNQIIFTSTCTQACEWSVKILSRLNFTSVHISPTEHPAINQAFIEYEPLMRNNLLDVNSDGVIIQNENNYNAVICTSLQNEIGVIQPVENINCKFLLSDMCQVPGKLKINLSSSKIDIAVFGAHKFGGPASVGFLYMEKVENWNEFGTGSRYFMDRPGTPDVASIAATAVSLEEAVKTMQERHQRTIEFRNILEPELKNMGFSIIAENANRCPNTTFVHMPNGQGMLNMLKLGEHGIHVGLGSACGSAATGPSLLMSKLGHTDSSHSYMRISQFGEYGKKEAQLFLDTLRKCIN